MAESVVASGVGAPAPAAGGAATPFRSIGELAQLCGYYCWMERRLFEVTGSRASLPGTGETQTGDPELRVVLSQMSARHGFFAAQWRERLPVRAGVDAEALVIPPSDPVEEALDLIASAPRLALVLGGLATQFLPRLREAYGRHLAQASPVSEAPVRAVLGWAVLSLGEEIRVAGALVHRLAGDGEGARALEGLGGIVQRLLGSAEDSFPGARAS
jgi:hypothetical protein